MSRSIVQTDGIKRCYFTGNYTGRNGAPLEKHHIMNGAFRDWAEQEGLWIWVTPEIHRQLHDTSFGALVQKKLLKQLAQVAYERTHSREEWMRKVGKNYVG